MPTKFVPKPPLEKLSLATRKDVRDNFESKKKEWEIQATEITGAQIAIKFDANTVLAYMPDTTNAGSMLACYVEGFIEAADRFINTYGDLGKEYFKSAVHKG
ncbi:hypothetical protein CVT24_002669 [Panaeolus cyanescens]|uniref:Uncharacterized protein n=1 Tax=Panaeolus cyanescens TaxID=181874 RepID=A0A409X1U6_9AGAR|nr:hypothetical protein CVT24_002669 [Panaeolus cyanescens]